MAKMYSVSHRELYLMSIQVIQRMSPLEVDKARNPVTLIRLKKNETDVSAGDKNAQETSGDNVKKEVQKAAEPEKDKPKGTETNKKHVTTIVREDTDKKTVVSEGGTSPEAKPGVPKADASPKTSTDKDSKPDTVAKGPPKVSVIVPPMSDVNKT
eukprot:Tbor_TRINITY_DN5992_c0_g2::TRINITY_DN5992_c0_g2_i5::g.19470::m.19470